MFEQTLRTTKVYPGQATRAEVVIDVLSVLLIAAAALFVAVVNLMTAYDDAFITYRYAYNLASGVGFVYNPGEWFMGTTAPLYGLLLGALGFIFGPDTIPAISGVISGLSLLLTGIALYVYGRLHNHALCGLLAGLFFVTNRMLPWTFGGEMLFQVALIMWAFVAYRIHRTLITALLLTIAVLTRMDSLIAVGIIGLHFLVTQRRLPWREGLIGGAILLPFAPLSWVFYGSLLPDTLDAKLAQRDSTLWGPFFEGLVEWIRAFTIQGSSTLFSTVPAAPNAIRFIYFVAFGVIGCLLLFRFWLLPLAWIALYLMAYSILNVPFYHWYAVSPAFGLMILAACGIAGVVEGVVYVVKRVLRQTTNDERRTTNDERRTTTKNSGNALSGLKHFTFYLLPFTLRLRALLGTFAVLALVPGLYAQLEQTRTYAGMNPAEHLYVQAGNWLRVNTPPDASVGYFEIGRVGYYAQRRLIDPLGLVDPNIIHAVRQRDLPWAYREYRPDYIIYNEQFEGWFRKMLKEPWFRDEYREIESITFPGYPVALVVYERQVLLSDQ
jgi:hypothetical protein